MLSVAEVRKRIKPCTTCMYHSTLKPKIRLPLLKKDQKKIKKKRAMPAFIILFTPIYTGSPGAVQIQPTQVCV